MGDVTSHARKAPRLILALLLIWLLGFELHNTLLPGLPDALFGKVSSQVMQLVVAGLVAARAAVVSGPERRAWALIAAGMALWTAGDLYWTFVLYDLEAIPIPSPADAGYLLVIPFLFSGIVVLVRARFTEVPRTLWLDGLVAALAAAALSAVAVFGQVTDRLTGQPADPDLPVSLSVTCPKTATALRAAAASAATRPSSHSVRGTSVNRARTSTTMPENRNGIASR